MSRFERVRHWLPLLPLLGLLAVTYWLNQQVQLDNLPADSKKLHVPDAVMEGFSALTLDTQGLRRGLMTGKTMLHYPDDDSSEILQPRISSFAAGRAPLQMTAQKGVIQGRGDEVQLQQGVQVVRPATADVLEMRVYTEFLRVLPNQDWCGTDLPVRMEQGRDVLSAVGMEMDNRTQRLLLRANIRADYATPAKP